MEFPEYLITPADDIVHLVKINKLSAIYEYHDKSTLEVDMTKIRSGAYRAYKQKSK